MAITYTEEFLTVMGDKVVGLAKITHDASATTVNLPTGQIVMAHVLEKVGTNSSGVTVSWSGSTLTFSAAAGNSGAYEYVYWIGTA